MVSIRSATTSDIKAIRAIELDAGRRFAEIGMPGTADAPLPTATELAEPIESGRVWVAEDPVGTAVGFVLASVVDEQAHVTQVSVRMVGGGRGVGRALIEAVEEWGRSHGFDWLTLTTFRNVAFNGPWYERLGFEAVPPGQYGPQLEAIRAAEVDAGLDAEGPRLAMRRAITPADF